MSLTATDDEAPASAGKLWDTALTRVSAVTAYLAGAIYLSGVLAVGGRLFRRDVPFNAVLGQIPKSNAITVGAEEVLLPCLVIALFAYVVARRQIEKDWLTGKSPGAILVRLLVSILVAFAFSAISVAISSAYKRNIHFSNVQQLVGGALILTVGYWITLEGRALVINWAKSPEKSGRALAPSAASLIRLAMLLPILLLSVVALSTGPAFTTVYFCGGKYVNQSGNLISQDGTTIYALQTFADTGRATAQILIIPMSSVDALSLNGPCPSESTTP